MCVLASKPNLLCVKLHAEGHIQLLSFRSPDPERRRGRGGGQRGRWIADSSAVSETIATLTAEVRAHRSAGFPTETVREISAGCTERFRTAEGALFTLTRLNRYCYCHAQQHISSTSAAHQQIISSTSAALPSQRSNVIRTFWFCISNLSKGLMMSVTLNCSLSL